MSARKPSFRIGQAPAFMGFQVHDSSEVLIICYGLAISMSVHDGLLYWPNPSPHGFTKSMLAQRPSCIGQILVSSNALLYWPSPSPDRFAESMSIQRPSCTGQVPAFMGLPSPCRLKGPHGLAKPMCCPVCDPVFHAPPKKGEYVARKQTRLHTHK